MPIVSIDGVGDVTFPDDMSPDDITRVIETEILSSRQPQPPEPPEPPGIFDRAMAFGEELQSSLPTPIGAAIEGVKEAVSLPVRVPQAIAGAIMPQEGDPTAPTASLGETLDSAYEGAKAQMVQQGGGMKQKQGEDMLRHGGRLGQQARDLATDAPIASDLEDVAGMMDPDSPEGRAAAMRAMTARRRSDTAETLEQQGRNLIEGGAERVASGAEAARFGRELHAHAQTLADHNRATWGGNAKFLLGQAVESGLGSTLPAIAVGAVTRSPNLGLSIMGAQVYGQQYGAQRAKGRTPEEASLDAAFYALSEVVTEKTPLEYVLRGGKGVVQKAFGGAVREGAAEAINEGMQIGYNAGMLDETMTLDEALKSMAEAGVVGGIMGFGMGVITPGVVDEAESDPRAGYQESLREREKLLADVGSVVPRGTEHIDAAMEQVDAAIAALDEAVGVRPVTPRPIQATTAPGAAPVPPSPIDTIPPDPALLGAPDPLQAAIESPLEAGVRTGDESIPVLPPELTTSLGAAPGQPVQPPMALEAIEPPSPGLQPMVEATPALPAPETTVAPVQPEPAEPIAAPEPVQAVAPESAEPAAPESTAVVMPKVSTGRGTLEDFPDTRLKRKEYRDTIQAEADALVKGGEAGRPIYDENQNIVGRTPTVNPSWVSSTGMTVEQIQNAVRKAIAGERLGHKQAQVVEGMLEEVAQRRNRGTPEGDSIVDEAVAKRSERRALRDGFAPIDAYEDEFRTRYAEDAYEADAYDPDWNDEARLLADLATDAREVDEDATMAALESSRSDGEIAADLWRIIKAAESRQESTDGRSSEEGGREPAQAEGEAAQEASARDAGREGQEVEGGDRRDEGGEGREGTGGGRQGIVPRIEPEADVLTPGALSPTYVPERGASLEGLGALNPDLPQADRLDSSSALRGAIWERNPVGYAYRLMQDRLAATPDDPWWTFTDLGSISVPLGAGRTLLKDDLRDSTDVNPRETLQSALDLLVEHGVVEKKGQKYRLKQTAAKAPAAFSPTHEPAPAKVDTPQEIEDLLTADFDRVYESAERKHGKISADDLRRRVAEDAGKPGLHPDKPSSPTRIHAYWYTDPFDSVEAVMSELVRGKESAAQSLGMLHGRGKARMVQGADHKTAIDGLRSQQRAANLLKEWRAQFPEAWAAYIERQQALKGLKKGDPVEFALGTSVHPGTVVRVNKKTVRVEYTLEPGTVDKRTYTDSKLVPWQALRRPEAAPPKPAAKPAAAAPGAFSPTHELADGTPVMAADDPGVWVDAAGEEIEDTSAVLITPAVQPTPEKPKPAKSRGRVLIPVENGPEHLAAIERHGLPDYTEFQEGGFELTRGKVRAEADGQASNWHETPDAAARELADWLEGAKVAKKERTATDEAATNVAAMLRRGEVPTNAQWRRAGVHIEDHHRYVHQATISPFLRKYMGFGRVMQGKLGAAHGVLTSDMGSKQPIVYPHRLAEVLKSDDLDTAAHEAATSPENDKPAPSPDQIAAGNYEKGHYRLHGLDISIENPKGSTRSGTDRGGKKWSVTMAHHYGYIRGTVGKDKDHIDVFLGPDAENAALPVFIVDQVNPRTNEFDEHKVMIGFADEAAARAGYLANYSKGWKGIGAITAIGIDPFKVWAFDPAQTKKRAAAPAGDPALAKRLRDLADGMENAIQAKLDPGVLHQNATARRARMGASSIQEGERLQRTQAKLRALADAHDNGTIPPILAGIRTRADLETFARTRRPNPTLEARNRDALLEAAKGLRGVAAARGQIGGMSGPISPATADAITKLRAAIKKNGRKDPWQYMFLLEDLANWKRLQKMGVTTEADWTAAQDALKAIDKPVEVSAEDAAAAKVRKLERELIGAKGVGVDYFPTPAAVVDRMIAAAALEPGLKVLEPSAGKGNIADAIRAAGVEPDVVELSPALHEILVAKGYRVVGRDFMQDMQPGDRGQYDVILMNPPFSKLQDVEHVTRAYQLLAPGGRLVAITSESPFFRDTAPAAAFRDFVEEHGHSEELAPGDLADAKVTQRSNVKGRMVVLDKPEDAAKSRGRKSPAAPSEPVSPGLAKIRRMQDNPLFGPEDGPRWAAREAAYREISKDDTRDLSGVQLRLDRDSGGPLWVMILEDASEPGKWRLTSFDERGLSGHTVHDTASDALYEAVTQGYMTEDAGAMDRLSTTEKWREGMEALERVRKANAEGWKRSQAGQAEAEDQRLAEIRSKTRKYVHEVATPALRDFFDAYKAMGVDVLERNRIKPEGLSGSEWLEKVRKQQPTWHRGGRKIGTTGIQMLSQKGLWPTDDARGEKLRKAMLKAVRALKNAPGWNDQWTRNIEAGKDAFEPEQKAKSKGEKLDDLGEKIGGARKDTAQPLGKRGKKAAAEKVPAWKKRFIAMQRIDRANPTAKTGQWDVVDTRRNRRLPGGPFSSMEEADRMVPLAAVALKHSVYQAREGDTFEIVRRVTDRKRVTLRDGFADREAAMRYMAEHAAELLEQKTTIREDVLVKPEKVVRKGPPRREGNVAGNDFMTTFGFRGVEFGNWNNQDERQEVMNHAYDGLLDLAELLDVPPLALSLNGDLGLAFGARGQGLSGARAHYETQYGVINLTKMQGAGALAHEWFHALDHYFARQEGKSKSGRTEKDKSGNPIYDVGTPRLAFASHGFLRRDGKVRPELREKYTALIQGLFTKAEQYVEDTQRAEKFVSKQREQVARNLDEIRSGLATERDSRYYKRHNKPASDEQLAEFDAAAENIINGKDLETAWRDIASKGRRRGGLSSGRMTNDSLERISAVMKKVRGRQGFSAQRNDVLDGLRVSMTHYKQRADMLESAEKQETKTRKTPTSFAMEAKKIDQGSATDYWSTEHEMAARAFSAYVEDRLAARDGASDFLSYGSDNKFYLIYGIRPFPEGAEREDMNASFDALFAEMQTRETERGVELHEERVAYTPAHDFDLALSPRIGRTQDWALFSRRRAGRQADVPQYDLFAAPAAAPDPSALAAKLQKETPRRLKPRVRNVRTGTFRMSGDPIKTPEAALSALAALRREAQETMVALVLDADSRPIAVARHTIGTIDGASVFPHFLAAAVAAVDGAQSVVFAHNHPSGVTEPSRADTAITKRLIDMFQGTGIDPIGMAILGAGSRRGHFLSPEGFGTGESFKIGPRLRKAEVPMVERRIRRVDKSTAMNLAITSPATARVAVANIADGRDGLLLLDTRSYVLDFLPMSLAEMQKLRTGDASTGAAMLWREVGGQNAAAMIPVLHADPADETPIRGDGPLVAAFRNVSSWATSGAGDGVRVLDAMVGEFGSKLSSSYTSLSEAGMPFEATEPTFFSRPKKTPARDLERMPDEDVDHIWAEPHAPDDEYLYHVTSTDRAEHIERQGLDPRHGGSMFEGGVYKARSRGKVHFTERSGLYRWSSNIESILESEYDDPPGLAVFRVKKSAVPDVVVDELGTKDAAGAGAYTVGRNVFSRGRLAGGMSAPDARTAIMPMLARWEQRSRARVTVVDDEARLPASLRRQYSAEELAGVEGVFHEGAIYLVASNLRNAEHARLVLAHEAIGHMAVHDILTRAEMADVVDAVLELRTSESPRVRRIFEEVRERYGALPDADMAHEFLAIMVEQRTQDGTLARIWRMLREAVARWTRSLGLRRSFTEADIDALLTDAGRYLEGRAVGPNSVTGKPNSVSALSRAAAAVGDTVANFRRWFGDSKVVDANGAPMVVYHGTRRDVSEFVPNPNDGALWFTSSTEDAGRFSEGEHAGGRRTGANIMPAYLSMSNPLVVEYNDVYEPLEIDAIVDEAREGGYDGAIIKGVANFEGSDPATSYVVFRPEQIKSVNNRGTFDPNDPNILRSEAPAPFYSQLTRTVAEKLPGKGTAKQYRAAIEAYQRKGQVKAEEVEWSGVLEWLKSQEGRKLDRAAVLDFVRSNEVQIKEVTKGEEGRSPLGVTEFDGGYAIVSDFGVEETGFATEEDAWAAIKADTAGATRFDQPDLNIEGGDEYREVLLTMPVREELLEQRHAEAAAQLDAANAEREALLDKYRGDDGLVDWSAFDAIDSVRERHLREAGSRIAQTPVTSQDTYTTGHWNEDNVLAHVRLNTRTSAGGNLRTLFVEEVQSDWHQEGRKQGYRSKFYLRAKEAADRLARNEQTAEDIRVLDQIPPGVSVREMVESGVPDAPFKKSWPMLAMKRVLRMAAEEGYDQVQWTTGEQQADRYDMSRRIERISVSNRRTAGGEPSGRGVVMEMPNLSGILTLGVNQDGVIDATNGGRSADFQGKPLADVIGRELAQKVMAAEPGTTLDGLDLKVGGAGLRSFYDRELPNEMRKYVKKWGAKVTQERLAGEPDQGWVVFDGEHVMERWPTEQEAHYAARDYANGHIAQVDQTIQHTVQITDKMREGVMQGQPLFSRRQQGEFQLEPPTSRSLRARDDAEAQRQAEEEEAARRAEADRTVGEFELTGSDRPADRTAKQGTLFSRGRSPMGVGIQRDMFVNPPPPPSSDAAFWRFFGDSKVIEGHALKTGKAIPRVVYHGSLTWEKEDVSLGDITIFDRMASVTRVGRPPSADTVGSWFTSSPDGNTGAELYSGSGGVIYPVYLSIQNPWRPRTFEEFFAKYNTLSGRPADQTGPGGSAEPIRSWLKKQGHDGIIFPPGTVDGQSAVFVALEPTQIKSAVGNRGTYDPKNPSILFSRPPRYEGGIDAPELTGESGAAPPWTPDDLGPTNADPGGPDAPEGSHRTYTAAQRRALAKIAPKSAGETLRDKLARIFERAFLKARQGMVDQYAALMQLGPDTWKLARMSHTSSGAVEAAFVHGRLRLDAEGAIDVDTQGEGLAAVLRPLGEELDDWLAWVAGNRAAKLKEEGRERLFEDDEIVGMQQLNRGMMADGRGRATVYAEVHEQFNAFQRSILDIAERTGLINAEDRATWESNFYVPFYRLADEEAGTARGPQAGGGLVNQVGIRRLKGANIPLNDLLSNVLMNWQHLAAASLKNQAATRALDAAVAMEIAEPVRERDKSKKAVFIMREGKKEWYEVHDHLVLDAITALSYEGQRALGMRSARGFKRVFTYAVTASPEFRIANLIRDSLHAVATSPLSYNVLNNVRMGVAATAKDHPTKARMLAGGGEMHFGHLYAADPEAAKRIIRRRINTEDLTGRRARRRLRALPSQFKDWWDEWGSRAENVNRAAIYEQMRARGASHAEASFEARDLADFSQGGSWPVVRFLTQTVPFLNARIQGLDKGYRSMKNPAQRLQFAAVTAAVAMASMALYVWNRGDPDFDEREEWERDAYWFVKPPGSDVFVRIPKPFEVGAIGTVAERTLEAVIDGLADKPGVQARFVNSLQHMFLETFSFTPVPQFIQPIAEVATDKNWFTGRPIEGFWMKEASPEQRRRPGTSPTAIGISQGMAAILPEAATLSPLQVEHLVQGYTAWLGSMAIGASDQLISAMGDGPVKPERRIEQYPGIGRFVRTQPPRHTRYETLFYDHLDVIRTANADVRQLRKLGDLEEALEKRRETADILRYRKIMESSRKRLAAITKQQNRIRLSERLTAKQKREKLDDLSLRRAVVVKRAVERVQPAFDAR